MGNPYVSIVIPTYNSQDYITQALNSVIFQDYRNFEIIVSDDGSQDETSDTVRRIFSNNWHIKTRFLENPHRGPGDARNQAILVAEGDWIAFLDSDDLWYENKLTKVAENINRNPAIDLWCHSEIIRAKKKNIILEHYRKFNPNINQFLSMYRSNSLSTSAVTVKKEALLTVGLFDADARLSPSEDLELWLRLAKTARIGYIKEVLGVCTLRERGISSQPKNLFRALMFIAEREHPALKNISKFYFIEEIRFKSKVFSATGLKFLSQKEVFRGLFLLGIGILLWPFRFSFIKRFLRNFNIGEKSS
jgi:glycosyltransferase involved in cell wall biosynthesis